MKIGIFGDSFAYWKLNDTPTWSEILNEQYEVTNYGAHGSNLYWSIGNFLQHKHKFDKIIFIVTLPGRLLIDPDPNTSPCHLPNIDTAMSLLNQMSDPATRAMISAAIDYFKYLDSASYNEYIHKLMYNDLCSHKTDNTLIIDFSVLSSITSMENTAIGLPSVMPEDVIETRNCHLTPSNNKIFADVVDNWITTGDFNINYNQFNYLPDEINQFMKQK